MLTKPTTKNELQRLNNVVESLVSNPNKTGIGVAVLLHIVKDLTRVVSHAEIQEREKYIKEVRQMRILMGIDSLKMEYQPVPYKPDDTIGLDGSVGASRIPKFKLPHNPNKDAWRIIEDSFAHEGIERYYKITRNYLPATFARMRKDRHMDIERPEGWYDRYDAKMRHTIPPHRWALDEQNKT